MMDEHTSREYRSAETVRRDGLWPAVESDDLTKPSVRLRALQDVLRRLPPTAYHALKARPPQIQLQCDDHRCLGQMRPPRRDPESPGGDKPSVVQLAEVLEHAPWPIVVTVVAHELAHVVLNHAPVADLTAQATQEIESWNAVRQWGFAAEADVAEFLLRHD
jgi:hypothetical protein